MIMSMIIFSYQGVVMNIYTLDIIIIILLIIGLNDPLLRFLQGVLGSNFIVSEIIIGVVVIFLMFVIHKYVLRRFFFKK